jgi:hypothetical protein
MCLSCLVCSHLTKTSIVSRAIQVSYFDHLSYAQQERLLKLSFNSIRSFCRVLIHILLNQNPFDRSGEVIPLCIQLVQESKDFFFFGGGGGGCSHGKEPTFSMYDQRACCMSDICLSDCLCSSCSVASCPLK